MTIRRKQRHNWGIALYNFKIHLSYYLPSQDVEEIAGACTYVACMHVKIPRATSVLRTVQNPPAPARVGTWRACQCWLTATDAVRLYMACLGLDGQIHKFKWRGNRANPHPHIRQPGTPPPQNSSPIPPPPPPLQHVHIWSVKLPSYRFPANIAL